MQSDTESVSYSEDDANIPLINPQEYLRRVNTLQHTPFHNNQVNPDLLAEYWDLICEKLPDNAPAKQFALILYDNDTAPLKVSWSYLVPLSVSLIIGIPANVVFIPPALSAASKDLPPFLTLLSASFLEADTKFLAIANTSTALVFNCILNVYFVNKLTMPLWDTICDAFDRIVARCRGVRLSYTVLARDSLIDLDNSCTGVSKRYSLIAAKVGFCSALSLSSALTMFFLDLKSGHPIWSSLGVLASFTVLNYNGVLGTILPAISCPIQALYHNRSTAAKHEHQITENILRLKAAHISLLSAALMTMIDLLQKKDNAKLDTLFALSENLDKDPKNSKLLYCRLLALAQEHSTKRITQIFRFVLQALGATLNLGSLPGYYFETAQGTSEFFASQFSTELSPAGKYLIGLVIFSPLIGLSCDVAQETVGEAFDFNLRFASGIRKSYKQARQADRSTFQWVRSGFQGSWSMRRWSRFCRLPLAVQQNPALMLIPLYFLMPGGYFTTATTLALNDDWLGPNGRIPALINTARFLVFVSIVFVWIFNIYPVRDVLYEMQEVGTKLLGHNQEKKELRLALFIRSLIKDWATFSPEKSLAIFADLLNEPEELQDLDKTRSKTFSKELTQLFFRHTPVEIFGSEDPLVLKNKGADNERVVGDMREVIDELSVEVANLKNIQPKAYKGLRVFNDRQQHDNQMMESLFSPPDPYQDSSHLLNN